ncbi:hypothetical protein SAMN05216489_05776 [Streptomyces sp. 3213]|uniref:hypothetical protein n=1 Tax=Streptomyces sp. 3213.3 TaxID=1855348 RepID=UPI000894A89E|nr:hypothetical protein [Streptomyces sp. 3213.3]SEE18375.1 hypothetical protein SAMN05216489_05776 [Streptomyces sp. 3213] [Streptomyces sp. 3213.3]
MRIRATVAAVSGALVLSAFAVPAAQAADATSGRTALTSATADGTASAAATLNVTFSKFKVNNGKAIVVGASAKVAVPVTYTLTHAASLDVSEDNFASGPFIYLGTSASSPSKRIISDDPGTCTAASTTVLNCKATLYVRSTGTVLKNANAVTWKAAGLAINADGTKTQGDLGNVPVRRASQLTADATPEPVKKGKTITVTGKLSRANWETHKNAGYAGQSVKLQFRKNGSSTYTTVKTIKTSSTGALKTTVTATVDGYFRYSFAGTASTAAVNATGDFVDVK